VKRVSTLFALTALAAATVALAQQQTTPQSEAPPPASPSQSQTPSDPSDADKQAQQPKALMMKDCMTQVQAANPTVPEKDIRDFCNKQVNSQSSQPN